MLFSRFLLRKNRKSRFEVPFPLLRGVAKLVMQGVRGSGPLALANCVRWGDPSREPHRLSG